MKVELITCTPDADKLVAAAAKLCYAKSDIDTLMDKLTPDKVESFLNTLAKRIRACARLRYEQNESLPLYKHTKSVKKRAAKTARNLATFL